MKDLLSKEHYCYKTHTLMRSIAYPVPSIDKPPSPYLDYPSFLQENLDPPSMIFKKFQPPL